MDEQKTTANEDVVSDVDHPQYYVAPKTNKLSRDTWFKQPPRPPTPDPEWNKRQVVTVQPEQPWFNHMVYVVKDPLTFDELMATPNDFSKYKRVSDVKKLHGYGHLEEIVVKRADRKLYKFKEGDFVDLHLNDIEDMLLLAIQHKLFHLNGSDIVDFIVALHGTLKTARDELHHIKLDFRLGYNKEMLKRKWTATDKRRSELMVELIDKQIRERRILQNQE
ncbi:hypothetical protein Tco_0674256 [Tanacetum coccineum]